MFVLKWFSKSTKLASSDSTIRAGLNKAAESSVKSEVSEDA